MTPKSTVPARVWIVPLAFLALAHTSHASWVVRRAVPVLPPHVATVDAFTADGARMAFTVDGVASLGDPVSGAGVPIPGAQGVSNDGARVLYFVQSPAHAEVFDLLTSDVFQIPSGDSVDVLLSGDGSTVAFDTPAALLPDDTNGTRDVYAMDLATGALERVSLRSDGSQSMVSSATLAGLSDDGRRIVIRGPFDLIVGEAHFEENFYVRDRLTGVTTFEPIATGDWGVVNATTAVRVSADAGVIALESNNDGIVPGDDDRSFDVFVRDRPAATTESASRRLDGSETTGSAHLYALSGDGARVFFSSGDPVLLHAVMPGFVQDGLDAILVYDHVTHRTTVHTPIGGLGNPVVARTGRVGFRRTQAPGGIVVLDPDGASTCDGGAAIVDVKASITRVGGRLGDETFKVKGRILLPPGTPAALDPATLGAQLTVEDLGIGGFPLFDLSHRTHPIPPVLRGAGCDPRDGWKANANRTKFSYKNVSGALAPPECEPNTAEGLQSVVFVDRREQLRGVQFSALVRLTSLPALVGPLAIRVVPAGDADASAAGACGRREFVAADCAGNLLTGAGTLTCRFAH